jgi:RNA polymerase sigma factor (sigma-70 family)
MYVQRFGHEDIVHEGVFGVMRAIDTYEVGVSEFSTYAAWWIRHFIQRAIENRLRTVRIPTYQITRALKINRQPENKRDVEDEEYLKAMLPKLGNTVTDMPAAAVAYDFADFEDLRRVREAMPLVLAPRELEVIVRRFGFSGPSRTLQEVGTELGVTRERVRQIERKALEKLRKALVGLE